MTPVLKANRRLFLWNIVRYTFPNQDAVKVYDISGPGCLWIPTSYGQPGFIRDQGVLGLKTAWSHLKNENIDKILTQTIFKKYDLLLLLKFLLKLPWLEILFNWPLIERVMTFYFNSPPTSSLFLII